MKTLSRAQRAAGLTLVEVLVAILVLAVGVIGAMAVQGTSIRASRVAKEVQELNAMARSELDVWRARLESSVYDGPQSGNCLAGSDGCSVEIRPCALDGATLRCDQGTVVSPVAQAVTVSVTRGERVVTLSSVVRARSE